MRTSKLFTFVAGLALSGAPAVAAQTQSPVSPPSAALDSAIAKQMADAAFVGLAADVIVNRQVVWMKGYGFADWQRTKQGRVYRWRVDFDDSSVRDACRVTLKPI